jgi:hypothetical protein
MADLIAFDLTNLEEVFMLCRKHGVRRLSHGLTSVEFGSPPVSPSSPETAKAKKDEDACPCGHNLGFQHSDAGCLEGCPLSACTPQYREG